MIFVLYNLVTTGQPLITLYAYNIIEAFSGHQQSYGFALPSLQAIWGLSFSLYLGLMPHVPVLLFGVYFLFRELFLHSFYKKLLLNYLTVFSFVFFCLFHHFLSGGADGLTARVILSFWRHYCSMKYDLLDGQEDKLMHLLDHRITRDHQYMVGQGNRNVHAPRSKHPNECGTGNECRQVIYTS